MKKIVSIIMLVAVVITLSAKGELNPGRAENAEAVLDLNQLQLVPSSTNEDKVFGQINAQSRDWQTVKDEGFEGAWPNQWDCYSTASVDCYWSDDNNRSSVGNWSGYCADGGSAAPTTQEYLNYMHCYMVYGPFSLSDATDADVEFDMWYETESDYDYVKVMASTNGVNWYGTQWSGVSNGWEYHNFDLTDVYTLGDLTGENQVWVAFIFESDVSNTYEGAYIDQINIDKYYEAPTYFGAPDIYSVSLENAIDNNGNGYYEKFWFELDVDAVSASRATYRAEDCYISVYRDDTGAMIGEWGPFNFNDAVTWDNVIIGPFENLVNVNTDDFGFTVYCENDLGLDSATIEVDIEEGTTGAHGTMTPQTTCLIGNYPNPFNPTTFISYNLGEAGPVTITIYNVKGELVRTLVNETQTAGNHTIMWDGTDSFGRGASSGMYFYQMTTANYTANQRMMLLK
jgi:hypothetical protein